jgi:4-amino-4-deoxy-L-arabinose transferase-like glycosyltransferase
VPDAAARVAEPERDTAPAAGALQQPPVWLVCTLSAAIVLTYFVMLGGFGLGEPDEGRYAEIPREMIALGDWVTPHLNYVKYFEKPPLLYWITAISFRLFGLSEFVARLGPALFGLLGIGVAYALGRSMYGAWVGCAAAAVLAASPLYFGLSQVLILDMPLSGLMAVALGSFWFAYTQPRRRRIFIPLLYLATALAVLTKGPVAVLLTGGIIALFLLLRGDLGALRWALSPLGICVFLVVALPWFVLVSLRNPEFPEYFIVNQHLRRYLTTPEHHEPIWYFVPIVFGGTLPWSGFVLLSPGVLGRFLQRLMRRRVSAGALYLVVWSAVIFVFFSLSTSKLGTYVLPMFCALAVLLARLLEKIVAAGDTQVLRRGYIGVLVLGIAMIPGALITAQVTDHWRVPLIVDRMYIGSLILMLAASAALVLLRRSRLQARRAEASLVALFLGILALQVTAISGREVSWEFRPIGMAIRQQLRPDDLVVGYRQYVQSVPFYTRHRVVMVLDESQLGPSSVHELAFGSRQGNQRAFFWRTDDELLDAWKSGRRIFLVINRTDLDRLRPRMQPPPREIAAYTKKVVVVNFAEPAGTDDR